MFLDSVKLVRRGDEYEKKELLLLPVIIYIPLYQKLIKKLIWTAKWK